MTGQGESNEAKAQRKALKGEIDSIINKILQESLDNMREAKAASKTGGFGFEKNMNAAFDEVQKEDEKIRDKQLELNNQNSLFRNNEAAIANKEFELKMLESE